MAVPICYRPRGAAEGKKIGRPAAWGAVAALVRWRFAKIAPRYAPAKAPGPVCRPVNLWRRPAPCSMAILRTFFTPCRQTWI